MAKHPEQLVESRGVGRAVQPGVPVWAQMPLLESDQVWELLSAVEAELACEVVTVARPELPRKLLPPQQQSSGLVVWSMVSTLDAFPIS